MILVPHKSALIAFSSSTKISKTWYALHSFDDTKDIFLVPNATMSNTQIFIHNKFQGSTKRASPRLCLRNVPILKTLLILKLFKNDKFAWGVNIMLYGSSLIHLPFYKLFFLLYLFSISYIVAFKSTDFRSADWIDGCFSARWWYQALLTTFTISA